MNRVKIKEEARGILRENFWNVFKPLLIYFGISLVIGMISGISYASDPTQQNTGLSLLSSVIELLTLPIGFGILVYEVKLVRKQDYDLKELFGYYSKFWPIFCLSFLVGLFTFLWSLLLLIPGIIAAIKYSRAMLIMVDGEDNAMECINKSKAMMNGYKWDYFVFQLSFILWHLLGIITCGLAYIYVGPYIYIADILYYEELKKVHSAK